MVLFFALWFLVSHPGFVPVHLGFEAIFYTSIVALLYIQFWAPFPETEVEFEEELELEVEEELEWKNGHRTK